MVTHQTNRTFICSTVFVDLVEYSKKSVTEQLALKDRFTSLLAEALQGIDVNERIILDTGDGAAMSFLGDPESALFVGMSLRDAFNTKDPADPAATAPIRIGINLGPVKLVKDINGHPNIVGDGINVAQRIMSFADSGQILVSRSFHDVVSCLSDDYAALFRFEGSRTDKHVRDHEVYAVGDSEAALSRAKRGVAQRAEPTPTPRPKAATAAGETLRRAQTAATGTVSLAVLPWGEVFVNGRSRGVSPPLKNLKLAPGTYTIEVRNTTFAPLKQKVRVKAREEVTVRHVFK